MTQDGHLTRLDTAFSRDQAHKIYVQDRMVEHGAELWEWLNDGAQIYVCGDALRMVRDVDAALHSVVEKHGNMNPEAARRRRVGQSRRVPSHSRWAPNGFPGNIKGW